jgi:hypothetical protein
MDSPKRSSAMLLSHTGSAVSAPVMLVRSFGRGLALTVVTKSQRRQDHIAMSSSENSSKDV